MSPMFSSVMSTWKLVGNILRQALDPEVAQVVLDDAAFLHAGGLAELDDRDLDRDRLGARHREEVDVDQRVVDVIALDLARHRQVRLAVDHEVEQDVRTSRRMEHMDHLAGIDRERRRLLVVSVEDRRHPAGRPELAGYTLAAVISPLGFEFRVHGRSF